MKPLPVIEMKEKKAKNKEKELERLLIKELVFGKSKIGITRKDKSLSKKKRNISKLSSKKNRIKKRHHWTTKEKKAR